MKKKQSKNTFKPPKINKLFLKNFKWNFKWKIVKFSL